MVFDERCYPAGRGKLTKIQHENDNLRDLNKKLIDKLRAARMSTKDATDGREAATARPRMASNSSASARRTPRPLAERQDDPAPAQSQAASETVADAEAAARRENAAPTNSPSPTRRAKARELNGRFIKEPATRAPRPPRPPPRWREERRAGDINDQPDAANSVPRLRELNASPSTPPARTRRWPGRQVRGGGAEGRERTRRRGAAEFVASRRPRTRSSSVSTKSFSEVAAAVKATETRRRRRGEDAHEGRGDGRAGAGGKQEARSGTEPSARQRAQGRGSGRRRRRFESRAAKLSDDKSRSASSTRNLSPTCATARRAAKDAHGSANAAAAASSTRACSRRRWRSARSCLS